MFWIITNAVLIVGCLVVLYRSRSGWTSPVFHRDPGGLPKTTSNFGLVVYVGVGLLLSDVVQSAAGFLAGIAVLILWICLGRRFWHAPDSRG
jgi:hypothetical protein